MPISFEQPGPPITPQSVDDLEAKLPGPLPTDYRAFLSSQNGGDPEPNWWPPEQGVGPGVGMFLGLGAVADYDSLVESREIFTGRIPDHLLAIGYDQGGGQVCVALTGDDQGSVWFYDPELELDGDADPLPLLSTRVCNSFTALLVGLEPDPGLEEMERRTALSRTEGRPA